MKWRCKMNKQKLIADLKQNFMLKRLRAQEDADNFIEKLRENPEFNELYTKYLHKQLEYAKSKLEKEDVTLKHDVEDLKIEIDRFLNLNKIDKSKLQPHYDCKICNDTGVAGGRICSCLQKEINLKISMLTSSQTEFKSFNACNKNIMDENDIKCCEWLKAWCLRYPNITKTNVNILGGAGSGKTFLLECVANELISKSVVVCYKTAFELNELARLYHIGKSYEFSDCLNAEVLLIDDLGTEPVLKNVTKEYLYNIINTRQIKGLPTFITSNLSLDNILDRYDDRIFSRLGNKNLAINIQLTSKDKRIK